MISDSDQKWLKQYAESHPSVSLDDLLKRREAGEPVAYILGEWEFYARSFAVGPGVLIPRPETELIIDEVKKIFSGSEYAFSFADFGSGSGCLGITIAKEFPFSTGVLIEKSKGAFKYLTHNLVSHDVQDRLEVEMDSVERAEMDDRPDLIVANPPYIDEADTAIENQVRMHEPHEALFADANGMQCIVQWLDKAMHMLKPGGYYLFEFGYNQSNEVISLLARHSEVEMFEIKKDLSQIDRVAICRSREG